MSSGNIYFQNMANKNTIDQAPSGANSRQTTKTTVRNKPEVVSIAGPSVNFGAYDDSNISQTRSLSREIMSRKEDEHRRLLFNEDYQGRYIGKETFDKFKTVETQQEERQREYEDKKLSYISRRRGI